VIVFFLGGAKVSSSWPWDPKDR